MTSNNFGEHDGSDLKEGDLHWLRGFVQALAPTSAAHLNHTLPFLFLLKGMSSGSESDVGSMLSSLDFGG